MKQDIVNIASQASTPDAHLFCMVAERNMHDHLWQERACVGSQPCGPRPLRTREACHSVSHQEECRFGRLGGGLLHYPVEGESWVDPKSRTSKCLRCGVLATCTIHGMRADMKPACGQRFRATKRAG